MLFAGQGLALLDDWKVVFGAMHGDMGFRLLLGAAAGLPIKGSEAEVFGGGGRMTQPHWRNPQNTTINAVIAVRRIPIGLKRFALRYLSQFSEEEAVLHLHDEVDFDRHERVTGVTVYEDPDAALPLPRNLFTGSFDLRYVWEGDGRLTRPHVGCGVLELEELELLSREASRETLADWRREPES